MDLSEVALFKKSPSRVFNAVNIATTAPGRNTDTVGANSLRKSDVQQGNSNNSAAAQWFNVSAQSWTVVSVILKPAAAPRPKN